MQPHVIYTRVSSEDQAREGVSLAAQREACELLCKLRSLTTRDMIEDAGFSAKSLKRPGIKSILAAIEAGRVQTIVVWRLDRLTRNLRDLLDLVDLFDKHKVALISVTEQLDTSSPMGRLMLSMLGAVAQWERESIAERVRLSVHHRRSIGGFIGGPIPSCCMVVGERGKKRMVADPAFATIAEKAWQRIIDSGSLADVATWLDERGVPAPMQNKRGAKRVQWNRKTVHGWLTNPRLIGLLVERPVFEACRRVLSERWSPQTKRGTRSLRTTITAMASRSHREWILRGIARCTHCRDRKSVV